MSRNYQLARLHTIHPTPSYASAVRLLSRASSLLQQSRGSLLESSISIEEPVIDISTEDLDKLASQIGSLDLAAKRALFAERVEKPVFFDTAFNYIELPLDELLVRAGKQPQAAASQQTTAVEKAQEAVKSVAPAPVVSAVKGIVRSTRESTPAVQLPSTRTTAAAQQEEEEEDEEEEEQGQAGQKKGWLGGWFGRK